MMGLFSFAKKAIKRVAKVAAPVIGGAFGGPAGAAIGGALVGAGTSIQPRRGVTTLPALPPGLARPTGFPVPVGGVGPGTQRLRRIAAGQVLPGAQGLCPVGFHPAKDGTGRCVRNRRMNPLNPRAARRAIRRIKGAMKMLKQIERQLPKQRVRRAPTGHRARLTHD